MLNFRFEVRPDETQFARTFSRWADQIDDLQPAFEQITQSFYEGEERQFASQGAAGSGGWKPLSSAYKKWKDRRYPGRPLLVMTGALRDALTSKSGPGAVYVIERKRLTMGTDLEVAQYHQKGSSRMPARKPIQLTDAQKNQWVKFIHQHCVQSYPGMTGADWSEVRTQDVHFGGI